MFISFATSNPSLAIRISAENDVSTIRIEVFPRRILKIERYVVVINFVEKFEKKIEEHIYIYIGFRFDISMGFFFFFFKESDCLSQVFHRKFLEGGVKRKETKE